MNYVRSTIYPNGTPIPASLPPSYQPTSLGNAPSGQQCGNCKFFQMPSRFCVKWQAMVKPRWWCEAWEESPIAVVPFNKPRLQEVKPYKRISTSIVEEHFDEQPKLKYSEDVIHVDVPLLIRLLEYAREDANSDIDLHWVAERLVELCKEGDVLGMEHYEDIVGTESKD